MIKTKLKEIYRYFHPVIYNYNHAVIRDKGRVVDIKLQPLLYRKRKVYQTAKNTIENYCLDYFGYIPNQYEKLGGNVYHYELEFPHIITDDLKLAMEFCYAIDDYLKEESKKHYSARLSVEPSGWYFWEKR